MNENLSIYEVVKEFVVRVDGFDEPIKARVIKNLYTKTDFEFQWEVSHYYKPTEDAGIYYPDNRLGRTYEDCRNVMFYYLKSFVNIEIVKNNYY